MMDLKDKVAVVTGAAQGLGRSFVEILLKNGSKVALIDVNKSVGNELKATLDEEYGRDRAEFYAADVSSEEDFKGVFEKIVEKFGRIDIVCNNAGIINEKHWEKTIAINLGGVVRGTYLALEHMKKENGGNGGVIVNIASMAGLGPLPMAPIYTATKHGVVGFSRAMAAVSKMVDYGGLTEMMMENHGCLEVDAVAKAFLVLVKDESKNGEVLIIEPEGAAFVSLPQRGKDFPSTPVSLQ